MTKTGLLDPLRVTRETAPGRYGDGGGLYLEVKPGGTKVWLFRYQFQGKPKKIGLGPFSPTNSLAGARKKAQTLRALLENGIDPQKDRAERLTQQRLEDARAMTFQQCAETFIATRENGWRNPKHRQQWRNTLSVYVYPILGKLPVASVDVPLVLKVLHQSVPAKRGKKAGLLWDARPDTAARVRGRIEAVLDWAKVNQYRQGENAARWQGNLGMILKKARTVKHHAALPDAEIKTFLRDIRKEPGVATLALQFLIFMAARTGEVLGARWSEIDETAAIWTVPAERMKAGREHRVPLTAPALAVLAKAKLLRRADDYVFPGRKNKASLSNMALLALMRRADWGDMTAHGMRSTFRDWAAEETNFPGDVAEMALAHAVSDKVEAAYRRGDLFEKRRKLMDAWAAYCESTKGGNVVQFGGRAA